MAKAKRGATNLCGIIAVDKPAGVTSHDVVDCLRRVTGEGRVGHAGTLDPAATGLLLVCVGPATRLSNALMAGEKTYRARIIFGAATDTDDADGAVIAIAALPIELADVEFATRVLADFVGTRQQMPPRFSARKKNGRKAYELARAGEPVELEPRDVTIHELRLIEATANYWDVEARVSKGTYIRSLARDLGEAVGSRAHLGALRRTRVGMISVERAHPLAELEVLAKTSGALRSRFLDPVADLGLSLTSIPEGLRQSTRNAQGAQSAQSVPGDQHAQDVHDDRSGQNTHNTQDAQSGQNTHNGQYVPSDHNGQNTHNGQHVQGGHQRKAGSAATVTLLPAESALGGFVCAIGVFDGLHEGHRFVIGEAIAQARRAGLSAVVITFDRDPDELFLEPAAQRKLLTNEDRVKLLATSGVDTVLVVPFDSVFAAKEPLEFLNTVIAASGTPHGIHVGADFRFGSRAVGTVDDLRLWGAERGCEVFAHKLLSDEGLPVTSTRVRNALQTGDLALANRLLTRPYFLWARVAEGRSMGRELGFPTANLELEQRLVRPADGVYAGVVEANAKRYRAAVSVGVPATFEGAASTIEAHLLDFEGNLYGCEIKISFVEYLRPMQAFSSVEDLKRAVQANIEQTRALTLW
jgi:riboflavin kinase/FMN adenylyltransferase